MLLFVEQKKQAYQQSLCGGLLERVRKIVF